MITNLDIEYQHPDYENNVDRWEFYLRSYMGGQDYQDGSYLSQYLNEDTKAYDRRIGLTPLDNHCKNVIHIYSSFLWRVLPTRNFAGMEGSPELDAFLHDANLDGQSFNSFMREAQIWSSVYGHVWLFMDKPQSQAGTRAEELEQEIRPYVTLITPENVYDWKWERQPSGRHQLVYMKIRESVNRIDGTHTVTHFREWRPDTIKLIRYDGAEHQVLEEIDNPIGKVPAVYLPANRSIVRGIGISDISDIAYMQKAIYQELSEIEQLIRISNHPTLVKTFDTDASAGAGAIINVSEDLDPGLRPFQMQPSGGNLDAIRASIESKIESINRMAHMGAVRGTDAVKQSGIALQTEFQMLNAKLSEKADILELAEEQLWAFYCNWQGHNTHEVTISYPDSFDLRDYESELRFLQQAKASGVPSNTFVKEVDKRIADLVLDDEHLNESHKEIEQQARPTGQFVTATDVATNGQA
tara:strand:+ start:1860 stop:3266 length:1407 start_codon:yes stop_codon:yes gene_type:complete